MREVFEQTVQHIKVRRQNQEQDTFHHKCRISYTVYRLLIRIYDLIYLVYSSLLLLFKVKLKSEIKSEKSMLHSNVLDNSEKRQKNVCLF